MNESDFCVSRSTFAARIFLTLLLSAAPSDCRAAQDPVQAAAEFSEKHPHAAVVVGVIRDGQESVHAFGTLGEREPDGNTLFEIGSITKVFTGTLLADAVLRNQMSLDEPIQTHLPDELTLPTRDDRSITALHLATHTSSLPVQPPELPVLALLRGTAKNPYSKYGIPDLTKSLKRVRLRRPIGSEHAYSNLGVGLLGHALAEAAGKPSYEAALIERILNPLKMPATRVVLNKALMKRIAPGHNPSAKPTDPWDFKCLAACGGLRSSVRDVLQFAAASMSEEDTELTRAFRFAKQPWRRTRHGNWAGLCWFRNRMRNIRGDVWWHNGGTGGYRSYLGTIPDRQIAVVVLTNTKHSVDGVGLTILEQLSPKAKQ